MVEMWYFNNLNYLYKYNNYIQNKDYNYLSNEYNVQLYKNKNNLNLNLNNNLNDQINNPFNAFLNLKFNLNQQNN